ncbi:MAG: hypothetical protein HON70_29635, partial [Lentisphaerae bacterium]|nr:hypothetical protein [Lentisphaerota bacterium]
MSRTSVVTTLFLSALSFLPHTYAAANLVGNAGFEGAVAEGGMAEGWYFFKEAESAYTATIVDGGRKPGKCLKISGDGEWAGAACARRPRDRTKRCMGAGWLRVKGEGTATVKFDYFDAEGAFLGSTFSSHVRDARDWQICIVVSGAADYPAATQVSVAAVLNGSGTAWFDDFALIQRDPLANEGATNLLVNGSIEAGAGSKPAEFFTSTNDGADVTMAWSRTKPHSGLRCLHIKGQADYAVFAHKNVAFDRGKTYVASGWARIGGGRAALKIDFFKDGQWLGEGDPVVFEGEQWGRQELTVDPTKYPEANRIGVGVVFNG